MPTPIILMVGQAGSGKDSAAAIVAKNYNAALVAQADPMKRFAQTFFGFTEEQLWGPSSSRNTPDPRFALKTTRSEILKHIDARAGEQWAASVLPTFTAYKFRRLVRWAEALLKDASKDNGLTPRKMLQTLGTEWGRVCGAKNMWIDYATKTALRLLGGGYEYHRTQGLLEGEHPGYDYVVITDGRFRNELVGVKALGGTVFQVKAPDADGSAAEKAGVQGHSSETEQRGVPKSWFDAILTNDKSLGFDALEEVVKQAMDYAFDNCQTFLPVEALIERKYRGQG